MSQATHHWVCLEAGNDWNTIYYTPLGESLGNGSADARRGVHLVVGKLYRVRIPIEFAGRNSTLEVECELVCDKRRTVTRDHGGTYEGFASRLRIALPGSPFTAPIESVSILLSSEELNAQARRETP